MHLCIFVVKHCSTKIDVRVRKNYLKYFHLTAVRRFKYDIVETDYKDLI